MISGIDVSHYQGAIDWPTVAASGSTFAFCKVSEDVDRRDDRGAENLLGARAAGLRTGAYHFLRPNRPEQQAAHFLATYDRRDEDLPPMLDVEAEELGPGAAPLALAWLRYVEARLAVRPIVYVSPDFARRRHLADYDELARFPLWVAAWGFRAAPVFAPWATWSIWQHSATGRVPGIRGAVDLNRAIELP